MSQGRLAASDAPSGGGGPDPAGSMLHTFVREGRSFSGHERNCSFLNLGPAGRKLADVSSISGFDFPDGGRAVARGDWDHDGDLDCWVANRSGPQVRFLRNDVPSDHHHLSIRLVGRECNRDAIGARVELVLEGSSGHRLVRTVRAGDGFLAQSSKWIHFGLGAATEIERLIVRWPGGDVERIRGLRADGRYRVEQGKGRAEAWPEPRRSVRLEASDPASPASSRQARVFSAAQLPVPSLRYRTFDGRTLPVVRRADSPPHGKATLVILWASWCRPCLVELREIARRADDLRRSGLEVVALSVDGLEEKSGVVAADLEALLERLGFPFASGMASEETVEKLQMVHDRLFDLHRLFPIPVSFLIDAEGTLAVIYRGPVDVQQLLSDVGRVASGDGAPRGGTLPFPGRWLRAPERMSPFLLAWDLLKNGYPDEGIRYVVTHRELLNSHLRFPELAVLVGNARLARGEAGQAITLYREALSLDSRYADAQNNLAWVLATHADSGLRDGKEAVQLAEAALRNSKGADPSVWSTLSAAYAEVGQFDKAVAAAEKGIAIAGRTGQTRLGENITSRLELYRNRQPYRAE